MRGQAIQVDGTKHLAYSQCAALQAALRVVLSLEQTFFAYGLGAEISSF